MTWVDAWPHLVVIAVMATVFLVACAIDGRLR